MTQHITVTTDPSVPVETPTVTHYERLASELIAAFDQITTIMPQLEEAQIAIAKFTRGQLGIPERFCATAIAAVEQLPELLGMRTLDPSAARDTLQFLDAFRAVLDKGDAFHRNVKFTFDSRKAELIRDSLQVYYFAKGLARKTRNPELEAHIANMARDLGRRGLTKAQREERKAAKLKAAAEARALEKEVKPAA